VKLSYSKPGVAASVFDLLETVFPGLTRGADNARALGGVWEQASTPFLSFEGGQAVSHVGRIDLPLVIMGERRTVGSVHAVATRPDCRGRGHYRRVMEELLADSAGRYETLVLTTEHPEYFTPFGFRRVEEHGFVVNSRSEGVGKLRRLDVTDPRDVNLLTRLLATREPVSEVVGVVDEKAIFLFNEGRRPLEYAEDLDVVLCLERSGSRVQLFDIVGSRIPLFSDILKCLPAQVEEVVFSFAPDRLDGAARSEAWLFDHDGPSYLMVRGPFAAEGQEFTLPRSART
jgi:predicted N-acetyltransferase YhbS